jgi:HPt (histidine-containing phosphotransfer) domain-containing protein
LNASDSIGGAAKPLVDLEHLKSACDGDTKLMRDLMDLYFGQADTIMAGLREAIAAGNVGEVDHLSHKLGGSSMACGMSAVIPAARELERNAKAGHLQGADGWFALVCQELAAVRRYMDDYLREKAPQ